jgi:nanoRNase/pAp phosphatase (c-di-AMP/oligoRNAs hydrolase)
MNRFLENPGCELNETKLFLLELEEERKQKYLEEMKDNMVTYKDKQGRNVAVFLSTKYAGEIKAYINDPSIDYYMFFDLSKGVASIRGKNVVDCSEVAKQFGGGGHRGAAGFQFKFDLDKFVEQFGLYKG